MSYVLAFVGFAALVILHEFGHFAAAKAVGMRVERFSLFFGPMLIKFRRGETEYGIGPIPLGGYVKITGQNPHEELAPEIAHRAYYRQPVWKRVVVILAGPAMNLLLAFLILFAVFHWHGLDQPNSTVVAVLKGAPASGQLRPNDRIVAIDGHRGDPTRLTQAIASHRCAGAQINGCAAATPARVSVLRQGRILNFAITPRFDATVAPARPRLGFSFGDGVTPLAIGSAARQSVSEMWMVTSETVSTVGKLFVSARARKQVNSIVGGYEYTRQAFAFDTAEAFFVLALISLSLAVINLFPFLPLDGGHVFWALAEKVRGRAIPFAIMERASVVGIALVAFVFIVGFSNDIHTLSNGGFHVH